MQSATGANHIDAGTQPEMIGVAQNDARIDFSLERFEANALYRARSSHRHEDWRFDDTAASSQHARACFTFARKHFKTDCRFRRHRLEFEIWCLKSGI